MNVRLALASLVAMLLLPAAALHAAPQVLGVMSSAEPVPMNCENGACKAELSAFCLQQGRSGPHDGTAYQAVDWQPLVLVATLADGSLRRLPAAPYLRMSSARGYSAVTASVAEGVRARLGAATLALEVGPHVTLVPVASAGDPEPVTAAESAEVAATLRPLASAVLESGTHPAVETVRLLNRLINALPRMAGGSSLDLAAPDGLWGRIVGGSPATDDANAGKAQAALAYESCRRGAHYVQGLTLRRCLEASHDALMSSLNEEYWRIIGAGS
ncbi:MAG: hypothetical protein ACHQF3_07785 [Alphaproteobacteria bacterium]